MATRRDKKKRVLRKGEGQRPDGRYFFKYQNVKGEVHFVYSWKLEPYDIPPAGKDSEYSLRELEKQIVHDIENGIEYIIKKYELDKRTIKIILPKWEIIREKRYEEI